jgi:transforming growth factor-beta-induced protein
MKKLSLIALLFAGLVLISSCKKDDDTPPPAKTIVELAQETPNLSILVDAVVKANLAGTLSGDGPFTVFAPTNAAFEAALGLLGFASLDEVPNDVLTAVLLYHVVSGNVKAADLTDTYVSTLSPSGPGLTNTSLQIQVTGGVKFNGSANPVTTDIIAKNGVIHIIDEVMLPKDVVQLALANPNFSSLVAALTATGLETDFVDVLSGDGPFTVFAPTNAAFAQLLIDLDVSSLSEIDTETLEAVLLYHVISGANVRSSQLSAGDVTTLGGTATISLTGGPKINDSNIIVVDVQGTNGVIHAIDKVLLPS